MHKFRTPLTKVKWASEVVAAEKNSLSPDGQIALNMIERANTSIVDLTNVLVSLNDTDKRSYSYNFKAFGLLAITAPLIEEYRPRFSEKKISLELNVPDGVKTEVYSDPSKIKFAFDILINNAYQYTPIGGKVVVSITSKENIVFWNITDNGIGISKENSSLIFSKFYRGENARHTSTEGTGIGLYLAHEIIRRGGGRISFSSPGESRGTTFTVSLPTRI
jgi:two-component system phosphate regulon sensor histidine kinase PhoR